MNYDTRINSLDNWIFSISYMQYMQLVRAFETQGKAFFMAQGAKPEEIVTEICAMSSPKQLTTGHELIKEQVKRRNNTAAQFRASTQANNNFQGLQVTKDPFGQIDPLTYTKILVTSMHMMTPTQCLVAQLSYGDMQLHLDNNKGYMGKRVTLVTNGVDTKQTGILEAMRAVAPMMRLVAGEGNAMPCFGNFIPKDAKIIPGIRPKLA